jgi:hypothetical protein
MRHQSISQREISVKKDKPTKSTGLGCPLPFSKDTSPHNEMDRLAQQWCQLMMNQIQEARNKKEL